MCAACCWTISDRIRLPADVALAQLGRRLEDGGRVEVTYPEHDEPQKVIGLRLADGRIGLWARSPVNVGAEKPWLDAREALRDEPVDVDGCPLIGVFAEHEIGTGAARFRNYHHVGTAYSWHPYPNSTEGKAAIRAYLLDPPESGWVCVLGDGQKHAAAYAEIVDGQPCCYLVGSGIVRWDHGDLARWLEAVEAVLLAGGREEEITSGRYARGGAALRRALLAHGPTLDRIRGSGGLDLALTLRRPLEALRG